MMHKQNALCTIAMGAMLLLSFAGVFGLPIAGVSVIVGVAAFFVNKAMCRQPFKGSGLDSAALPSDLRNARIWFWMLLPVVMNFASLLLAKAILPGFVQHVSTRTGTMLVMNQLPLLLLQLVVLALGEEIAWRAFFQQRAQKWMPFVPALMISSAPFSLGHIAQGEPVVVAYDLLFVFINSLIYGVVFKKTNNAMTSALSHLIANLSALWVIGLM